jgi:hypothetical protein
MASKEFTIGWALESERGDEFTDRLTQVDRIPSKGDSRYKEMMARIDNLSASLSERVRHLV